MIPDRLNPFLHWYGTGWVGAQDVQSRINAAERFGEIECLRALHVDGLQKTVRGAAPAGDMEGHGTVTRQAAIVGPAHPDLFGGVTPLMPPLDPRERTPIPDGHVFMVPRHVAVCPICGDDMVASGINALYERSEAPGEWDIDELQIDCCSEPDIDDADWDEWHRGHYRTPYIDWLPVEIHVLKWLNAWYRLEVDA